MTHDPIAHYWQSPENQKSLESLKKETYDVLTLVCEGVRMWFENPSERRVDALDDLVKVFMGCLCETLPPGYRDEVTVVPPDFKPGLLLYRTQSGSIDPFKMPVSYSRAAVEDDVQSLVALDRNDLWGASLESLANTDDPNKVGLSQEQLTVIKKSRLLERLSELEGKLVNHKDLFTDSFETIAATFVDAMPGGTIKQWSKVVTRCRAICIGLSQRGREV